MMENKKTKGLLLLIVVCMITAIANIVMCIDRGIFSNFIISMVSLLSFFVLMMYCIKDYFRKKYILSFFLILLIFLDVIMIITVTLNLISLQGTLDEVTGRYYDYSFASILEDIIFRVFTRILPKLFILINLYKKNKIIEYSTFIILIINLIPLILSFFQVISFHVSQRSYAIISLSVNISETLLFFWLWYTQIAQHIGFKEKIKFDYKPIKKKVAVTETTLEELKLMYDNGTITESEYNRRKSEIINKL